MVQYDSAYCSLVGSLPSLLEVYDVCLGFSMVQYVFMGYMMFGVITTTFSHLSLILKNKKGRDSISDVGGLGFEACVLQVLKVVVALLRCYMLFILLHV